MYIVFTAEGFLEEALESWSDFGFESMTIELGSDALND